MSKSIPMPQTVLCKELDSSQHDSLILIAPDIASASHSAVSAALGSVFELDKTAATKGCVVAINLPCKRLVFSPTGPLDRDYDDLRRFSDAGSAGVKRALAAGSKRPLVLVAGSLPGKTQAQVELAALLGCLEATYTTLEMRDVANEKFSCKLEILGWAGDEAVLREAVVIETGRVVARDIGGSDPERMAAPRVEEYVRQCFTGTKVEVEVQKGQEFFEREYPCLAAVNRCASTVARHDGRLIWLTYKGEGTVKKTVYLVGKGITYDTGGADIKAGGVMAGMSRDKCGAAATAGFMASLAELAPPGVKVVGALAMVRNSVGANCYVSDEIITSRAGVRIRVGNTDAEGRMAMVDVLCRAKELALNDPDPQLFTIATLTGHACLAVGGYSIVMDNGPAKAAGTAIKVQQAGENVGDMFEISTVRREDWDFIQDKSGEFVSVLQCNNAPSSRTPRGHQFPAAFMMQVAGLDKHQLTSKQPLKYSHMDIAGSAGDLPFPTTGAPIPALLTWLRGN
jgi:leucyl aminopeptidase